MKVVDMHCDTASEMYRAKLNHQTMSFAANNGHIDLEKLKKGDYLLQNFALYVNLKKVENPYEYCMGMLTNLKEEITLYKDDIKLVTNFGEIEENRHTGKISAMLTVEEGQVIMGSLDKLQALYNAGVRMMTLTWNYPNQIGYPNCLQPDSTHISYGCGNLRNGLTTFGMEVVQKMEDLGMIVDVSHLSDAGFYDVVNYTKKPFVASHSNARGLCRHVRNLTDDMIKCIANRGGVIGLNYEGEFLREVTEQQPLYSKVDAMIAHVKYILNCGGSECLGLGSDFDGINTPQDIKDASYLPILSEAMEAAKIPHSVIERIFYQNVLRVYHDVLDN